MAPWATSKDSHEGFFSRPSLSTSVSSSASASSAPTVEPCFKRPSLPRPAAAAAVSSPCASAALPQRWEPLPALREFRFLCSAERAASSTPPSALDWAVGALVAVASQATALETDCPQLWLAPRPDGGVAFPRVARLGVRRAVVDDKALAMLLARGHGLEHVELDHLHLDKVMDMSLPR